jgi:methylmalonyl-CoA mutase
MQTKFPDYSKAEWLAKVEKDLKGKPLESLNWEVQGEVLSPFWHREDQANPYLAVNNYRSVPCKSGMAIAVEDTGKANKQILDLLNKGANALLLFSEQLDVVAEQDRILDGVLLDLVDVYFQTNLPDERLFSPQFPVYSSVNTDKIDSSLEVRFAELLRQANDGLAAGSTAIPTFWEEATDDYFLSIASLRALRLCYAQVAAAYGVAPDCHLTVDPWTKSQDKYGGMVSMSAICTAAIVGGANTIFVSTGDTDDEQEKAFLRRVALNSMNVLHHEAHLNQVADPAAGSYYIEALTNTIARKIWTEFQQISKHG